jgi:serine O-acetyltransferase
VDIGSSANLLGPITNQNRPLTGSNAVVLCDVPDDCVASDVPAVIKPGTASVPTFEPNRRAT